MKSFERICRENYLRIYKYIFIMTRNRQISEDLTQEVFLKAYEKGAEFLNHPSPEGFLCKTAKFLTYDAVRRQAREKTEPLEGEILETDWEKAEPFSVISAEKDAMFDEEQIASQILHQLSDEEQRLYRRYYIQHQTMKEIAHSLGVKESTIRMRYLRLRRKIKKLVADLHLEELVI